MIQVITAVYNEELLMPLFLKNYSFADSILVLLDTATTDRTPEILKADPRVEIFPITYPDGLNWQTKSNAVNQKALESKADWVMAVDADEFIPSADITEGTLGKYPALTGDSVTLWAAGQMQLITCADSAVPVVYATLSSSLTAGAGVLHLLVSKVPLT